jgi:hypothetical protein
MSRPPACCSLIEPPPLGGRPRRATPPCDHHVASRSRSVIRLCPRCFVDVDHLFPPGPAPRCCSCCCWGTAAPGATARQARPPLSPAGPGRCPPDAPPSCRLVAIDRGAAIPVWCVAWQLCACGRVFFVSRSPSPSSPPRTLPLPAGPHTRFVLVDACPINVVLRRRALLLRPCAA